MAGDASASGWRLHLQQTTPSALRPSFDQPQQGVLMRRVGPNSFTEIYFPGCNPSYVVTSDGAVMIDTPQRPIQAMQWREHIEEKAPIRYLINTEPHTDHITGNAYFPHVTVVGHIGIKENFEKFLFQTMSIEQRRERF